MLKLPTKVCRHGRLPRRILEGETEALLGMELQNTTRPAPELLVWSPKEERPRVQRGFFVCCCPFEPPSSQPKAIFSRGHTMPGAEGSKEGSLLRVADEVADFRDAQRGVLQVALDEAAAR